jgi:hypothetical protein
MTNECTWKENEDGIWWSACGNAHEFAHGGPSENGGKYCLYCGKLLEEVPYAYEEMP